MKNKILPASILIVLFLFSSAASALQPVVAVRVAIHGYDAVAYFKQAKPAAGSPQFHHKWKDAIWFFSSAENRDLFKEDPQRHAPQYGGYCAYAVSRNTTAKIDPQAWKIVDDKLYLNFSPKIQKKWEQNMEERIAQADENWPKLLGGEN